MPQHKQLPCQPLAIPPLKTQIYLLGMQIALLRIFDEKVNTMTSVASPSRSSTSLAPHPVTATSFRDAMARLGSAVHIVTTDGAHGWAGFAASAVCSVTDGPPTLLVCIRRDSSAYSAVIGNGVLCVNTLEAGQEHLSQLFGGKTPMHERRAAAEWTDLSTAAPVLVNARIAFDCHITQCTSIGTHDVLFCTVADIASGAQSLGGLYYAERRYWQLADASSLLS